MRPNWDEYFMLIAKIASMRSNCLSKNFGAVIVDSDRRILSVGYNGSPSGSMQCSSLGYCFKRSNGGKEGNWDNCLAVHAEQNALLSAARKGISVKGATVYVQSTPCWTCLKMLQAAGIKNYVFENIYMGSSCLLRDEINNLVRHGSLRFIKISNEILIEAQNSLKLSGDRLIS